MTEPGEPTNPPESRICHECGTEIPAGAEECSRCALEAELKAKGFAVDLEALAAELPQLEILEEIGRGGMGVVFKGRQKSLGRDVAIKVLPKELDYDPSFSDRFLRECRTLAGLSHPNVVTVYDAGTAAGHHYLLMEFVDGTDLAKLMKSGEVQSEQALSIISQICEALQYAHDQGVVHRDIKPGNILLDREGHVKLGDFGLAKLLRNDESMRLTGTLQAMGTPQYMAPEQLERPLEVDHRADLYSLGVVLYELLTGELPLGRFEAPSKRAGVDVGLDEVVMKTLEKEPDRRYQSASEVRLEVDRASDVVRGGGGGRPRSVSTAEGSSKKGRKHYLGCGLLLLSVALLLWALGFSLRGVSMAMSGEGWRMHVGNLLLMVGLLVLLSVGMGVAGWLMRRSDRRRREEEVFPSGEARQEERVSTASYVTRGSGDGEGEAGVLETSPGDQASPAEGLTEEQGGASEEGRSGEKPKATAKLRVKISTSSCLAILGGVVLGLWLFDLLPEIRLSSLMSQRSEADEHWIEESIYAVRPVVAGVAEGRSQDWGWDVERHDAWNAKAREVFNFVGDRFALSPWWIDDLELSAKEASELEEALRSVRERWERSLIAHTDVKVLANGRVVGTLKPFEEEPWADLNAACEEALSSTLGKEWRSRNVSGEPIEFFRGVFGNVKGEFTFRRLSIPSQMNEEYGLGVINEGTIERIMGSAMQSMVEVDAERLLTDEKHTYDLRILYDMSITEPVHMRGGRRMLLHENLANRQNYWLDNDMRVILAHALGAEIEETVVKSLTPEEIRTKRAERAAELARSAREASQEEAHRRLSAFAVHGVSAHECEVEVADWFALEYEISAAEAQKVHEELADVFVLYLEAERNASTLKQLPDGTLVIRVETFPVQDEFAPRVRAAFEGVLGERGANIDWDRCWEFPYGRGGYKMSFKVHAEFPPQGDLQELLALIHQGGSIDFKPLPVEEGRPRGGMYGTGPVPKQLLRFLPKDDGPIFGLWEGRPILLPQAKLHYDLDIAEIARWNEVLTRRWQELLEMEEEFIEVSRDEDGVIECRVADSYGRRERVFADGKSSSTSRPFKTWVKIMGELLSGHGDSKRIELGLGWLTPFCSGTRTDVQRKGCEPGDRLLIQETEDGIFVTEHYSGRSNSYSYTGEIPQKFQRFIDAAGE